MRCYEALYEKGRSDSTRLDSMRFHLQQVLSCRGPLLLLLAVLSLCVASARTTTPSLFPSRKYAPQVDPQKLSLRKELLRGFASANITTASSMLRQPKRDVAHYCHGANPCNIETTPCYVNWDYLVLSTQYVNGAATFNLNIANGNADILVGPQSGHYWEGCCGGADCKYTKATSMRYEGGCGNQTAVVSMWNHNYVEKEAFLFVFNDGLTPGPN
jgi:hypothetical protein